MGFVACAGFDGNCTEDGYRKDAEGDTMRGRGDDTGAEGAGEAGAHVRLSRMAFPDSYPSFRYLYAKTLAFSTLITTHTFSKYVKDELDKATDALRCCRLEHKMPQHSKTYTYAAIL
eukprot:6710849-Pyramimonas_sp.AAC.1